MLERTLCNIILFPIFMRLPTGVYPLLTRFFAVCSMKELKRFVNPLVLVPKQTKQGRKSCPLTGQGEGDAVRFGPWTAESNKASHKLGLSDCDCDCY
jgi:hypothetical protein